ncbi:MAG TPA: hypothetical protein VEB22_10775 [Phycisphaerales bacterium]|nr:hypothetical protein [Phycisphaerales bacterium]
MPDVNDDLVARLDAFGARAAAESPSLPAALAAGVSVRAGGSAPRVRVPLPALAAAAVVVVVGGALVFVGAPPLPAAPEHAAPSTGLPDNMLAMLRRFNKAGGIDSAVNASQPRAVARTDEPVMRPSDARAGVLPR